MNRRDRAKIVRKTLDHYFPHPKPFLTFSDSYTLLIAVLLSAQCTDLRVNQITPALFKLASTPHQMTALSIADIEKIIRPCGLSHTKAKAIWNLSKQLIENHHGIVPKTFEKLEMLPGVGHKTASVVIATAFHLPAFPVDTHIFRCAKRWKLTGAKSSVKKTETDLKNIFPKRSWNRLHLQMIAFARSFCRARGHIQKQCPICSQFTS